MAVRQIPQYYVYEHWRLDKDECFYVGKGKKRRAYVKSRRGNHWNSIVKYLNKIGSAYEIRMVNTGLTEDEAFSLEIERIAFWRSIGIKLSNETNGGDGTSGMKHTEEAKAKMSLNRLGNQYAKGMRHSDEFKESQRVNLTQNNPMKNPEIAKKTAESLRALGDKHPTKRPETRAKNSASRKGKCAGEENGSAKLTSEDVIKIRASSEKIIDLAKKYGVSRKTIHSIKSGKSWKNTSSTIPEGITQ